MLAHACEGSLCMLDDVCNEPLRMLFRNACEESFDAFNDACKRKHSFAQSHQSTWCQRPQKHLLPVGLERPVPIWDYRLEGAGGGMRRAAHFHREVLALLRRWLLVRRRGRDRRILPVPTVDNNQVRHDDTHEGSHYAVSNM